MEKTVQVLDGIWQLKILGDNVYGIPQEAMDAAVPGSVYQALLARGMMPDPYYRDNELDAFQLMENDFEYRTEVEIGEEFLEANEVILRFEGIDTLADIYWNGEFLGHTYNMHRTWEFPVEIRRGDLVGSREGSKTKSPESGLSEAKFSEARPSEVRFSESEDSELGAAQKGDMCGNKNELRVVLRSPLKYIREENKKVYTGGSMECTEGFPHLRKAHCMFGWDWGPRLPDAGIFRTVELIAVKKARIESVYVSQYHERSGNLENAEGSKSESQRISNTLPEQHCEQTFMPACVELDFDVTVELFGEEPDDTEIEIEVTAPDGTVYRPDGRGQRASACPEVSDVSSDCANDKFKVRIPNPLLWWPHGYGEQPLYRAKVALKAPDGKVLDIWEKRIGLRTMTVNTDADEWGNCFAHEVNGVKIFAMGADYIPEDNILSRVTKERTRRLLEDAVAANHNSIRVWGGGYYLDDYFYDICDELGLIVWQDFMFACASYELDDEFEANVTAELRDNVRRLRHHACLGLWCGNNEMETQTLDKAWRPSEKQKYDYIKLFEYIIPKLLKEEDPQTFYWPSSPSAGGNFDNPWDENRGDTHYWDVWHGNKPFTEYRKFRFRYLSEFGFQSFPCLKTVESFTEPEDRNIFSRVMEMHQRNRAANGKILNYLSATYLYPKDFESLLYASQLLQADAIRYGVEHFRRHRGRCMGAVVWQLNDIWPVASWASIDYYGRWKALHYAEKRMFAPVMISCEEKGEISERPYCIAEPAPMEISARLHVANETMREVSGEVRWWLRNPDSSVLREGSEKVTVPALSGVWLEKMDFSDCDVLAVNLDYAFVVEKETASQIISAGNCIFTAPKHYRFENPALSCHVEGDEVVVTAKAFAQKVWIEGTDGDVRFSDNCFDMQAGERRVKIVSGNASGFKVRSVYDIA